MNLHDPTLLTAFLDDELDEPDHRAVEAALRIDADLSERLGRLRAVRGLLGDLERPALGRDLAGPVLRDLTHRWSAVAPPRFARPDLSISRSRVLTLGATLSTAACLVVALTAFFYSRSIAPPRPIAALQSPTPTSTSTSPAAPAPGVSMPSISTAPVVQVAFEADVPGPGEEERELELERRRVVDMLDQPGVRRLFVMADRLESATADVEALVRHLPRRRPRYGRIPVDERVIVDPESTGPAVIFVVLMDDEELGSFRDRLGRDPGLIVGEAEPARPAVVTSLADSGRVDHLPGTQAAALSPPPPGVAPFVAHKAREPFAAERSDVGPLSSDGDRSPGPATSRTGSPDRPAEEPGPVLIWVVAGDGDGDRDKPTSLDAH